jgi:hypothetical protein
MGLPLFSHTCLCPQRSATSAHEQLPAEYATKILRFPELDFHLETEGCMLVATGAQCLGVVQLISFVA